MQKKYIMNGYKRKDGKEVYQVSVYLTAEEKLRLKRHCLDNNTSVSNYIKTLVLDNYET